MELLNKNGIIVFDMDEVLVNISHPLYQTVRMNWPRFSPFFKNLGPLTEKQVLNRAEFDINNWLLKDECKENAVIRGYMKKEIFKVFFDTDIYANLRPTVFAQTTLMNESFMNNSAIERVIILTRTMPNAKNMKDSKIAFIRKYFDHKKISTIFVEEESKGEAIKNLNIDFTLMVDDEPRNILSVVKEIDVKNREFLMPEMGYNMLAKETLTLIHGKGATISTFKPQERAEQ